ncbi:class I SAM-dependent methyltransferase [Frankia sp. CNm7]|uniref:Class I SAM-dependent methyltransferase n=1 Tax=Frankia nepalensis TaxID=1836974 RepID=A0A937RIQ8_9ACTN|nr:class I SAM-dependent methyltransferase [Frankia nepalensis]MBL7496729.1 class I SAM-dependent methyltransferase [Frankia nepalensis]MBL7510449.1 class I SAM-dependent methyltransferase [Frankia nepalensis]MBL7524841.1 class I SAM-dependent methyltransferase [Frankia nepalensis]MBL7630957.1 class I SAM-dependent methyltransferase [Frankia nepalensis]
MDEELRRAALAAKGFMPEDEGDALYAAAAEVPAGGLILEVGTYCGKSTIYLAAAARAAGARVVTVDHHRGSEENQAGWEYHDPTVVDPRTGRMDTLPFLRRNLEGAGVEDVVTVVVGRTEDVGGWWTTPVALLFIDGGHAEEQAQADYEAWGRHVAPGGLLLIHDVFPDPADGGQAPYHVMLRALAEGFKERSRAGSLRVLERVA